MPSTFLFTLATLLLSLNFVRPFGLAISDWLYFGALGLAVIETLHYDRENLACWLRNQFLGLAGLTLFGAIISTSSSIFVEAAFIEIFQQLYVVIIFIPLIWIMVRRGQADNIISAFIASGVFTASIALLDYFLGTNYGLTLSGTPEVQLWGRYAGTLGHPNKFGYFLVLTVVLSFSRLLDLKPTRQTITSRLFGGFLLFIQLFGLYLSASLTAYLGLVLGLLVLLLASRTFAQRTYRFIVPLLFIGLLAYIVGLIWDDLTLTKRQISTSLISSTIDRVENITALSRMSIYESAVGSILQSPLVGVGYDQISTSGVRQDSREIEGTVHNLLLQIWYVGGLFAFMGWLAIYLRLGWMAYSALFLRAKQYFAPHLLGIPASVISILLMDQFQDAVYQREKWLVFGLLVGAIWLTDEKSKRNSIPVVSSKPTSYSFEQLRQD
jgi:O-antigen ligase